MHKFKLGPYKKLNLPVTPTFTEDDLDLGTIELAKKLAAQWAKNHKPAEFGDEVIISLRAECDNMFVPELSKSNYKFTLGDPSVLEPFNKINNKAGDNLVLAIPFPSGFSVERVSGKTVTFEVTVQEVIHKHPIELTDEIARQVDPEVLGTEELKSKLRKIVSENWQQVIWEKRIQSILDAIISGSEYEMNEDEFKKVFEGIVTASQSDLFASSNPQMLEMLLSGNNEFLYHKSRILAEKTIVENLIVREIARLENININSQELREARENFIEFVTDEESLNRLFPTDESLHNYLLKEKVINCLWEWNE
ncbi:MAG: trigger factor [Peptococcaceae bacterium]|nr:trigger factor [Peptococcaceae bacterium]